ncbi:hypothetical protein B0H14DRAFT_2341743 [Mycena olivaceomarginata]|nr:hypothetical protein B0H14DRAFT_2341743 [Mycena olivaceomarginata]
MQFTFAILAAFVSATVAAPTTKRQNSCPLQNLGGLSVTASADSSGKTRWDVFTISSRLIQQGDLACFTNDQPNGNEVFTAAVGSQPNLFTFQRKAPSRSHMYHLRHTPLIRSIQFKVSCGGCNAFASGNDLAADGCTFEFTDGTNGVGQCITFEAANSVVQLQQCEAGNPGQNFGIFSA